MSDAYFDQENRIEQALEDLANGDFPNATKAALWYDVEPRLLQRRVKGAGSRSTREPTNQRLTKDQERSLCEYVDTLDDLHVQIRIPHIRGAAEFIRLIGAPASAPHKPLGPNWVTKFLAQHPEYKLRRQQPIASQRLDSYDIPVVITHFERFKQKRDELGIVDGDIWNMDETGFRIGCGIAHMVVTRHVNRILFLRDAENRDFITSIECISASGKVIPPHLILKGNQVLHKWGNTQIPDDYLVGYSESGYSNGDLALEWLHHFDHHSRKTRVGAWRMLIFDGSDTHFTKPFYDYCMQNLIQPFILPAKATSWAQPLDVGCFQPLKHYYTEAVDEAVRMGDYDFNRLNFLDCIHFIRTQAFKKSTVISSFRKTGLVPWNPNIVLDPMREKNDRRRQHTPESEVPSGPLLMRTPTKPKDIIAYGLSMGKLLETKGDWVHEDFMPVLERYTRAASANARTSNLLKRDLMNIHKTAKRNKELKSIGGSVAGKSGSMTAGHIRQSLKTRHEDEVQLAQKRLDRAKTSVVIRAEKRITKNRRWLKAYDKELWKDLSDQKAMWTDWFICVEQIETRFPFYDYDRYDEW